MIDNYQRAKYLFDNGRKMALNTTLFPVWIGNSDIFWYERQIKDGAEYRLVNAEKATNEAAFDHKHLAEELSKVIGDGISPTALPICSVEIDLESKSVSFKAFDRHWVYRNKAGILAEVIKEPSDWLFSPDAKQAVFVRNYNLWIKNSETSEEKALTTDGEKYNEYGAAGTAWGVEIPNSGIVQACWSTDGKRVLTVQKDRRQVKILPVMEYVPEDGSVRPKVTDYKVAYPDDDHVEEYRLLAIDVENSRITEAKYGRLPTIRNSAGFFDVQLGWWGKDARLAYFIDVDRFCKRARLVEFDTDTGNTSVLFEEQSPTHIDLMLHSDGLPNFIPLPDTHELLWYSERSGWAHYYLYDLTTGHLKTVVTQGEWVVRDVIRFDANRRELFVTTSGRVKDRDPYYRDLIRVNIDTGKITTLITSDHDCIAITPREITALFAGNSVSNGVSATGNYAVVTCSRADEVPISHLLDRNGKQIMVLETADISALPNGWCWPEPVQMKAADGITDIYGLIYRPSDFTPGQSYPVLDHGMITPEGPWVAKGSFTNSAGFGMSYLEPLSLAELGFIVVQIDGRGLPFRSKAFMDESYGWMQSAGNLADHVAGIKQLAKRYPYMDLARVGISTFQGGPAGINGLLDYPDFYRVGIQATPHDSRMTGATMFGNAYEGPEGAAGTYPEERVDRLQGKLLIMHNMLDPTTPVAATFRLVHALQRADKDFDLVVEPKPEKRRGMSRYQIRRAWDFLVRHLKGVEPPKAFDF